MAYRIQYGSDPKFKTHWDRPFRKHRTAIISAIIAAVLLICATVPQVQRGIRELILPGDPSITEAALTAFVDNLKTGEPMDEAFAAFCRDIISNAEVS